MHYSCNHNYLLVISIYRNQNVVFLVTQAENDSWYRLVGLFSLWLGLHHWIWKVCGTNATLVFFYHWLSLRKSKWSHLQMNLIVFFMNISYIESWCLFQTSWCLDHDLDSIHKLKCHVNDKIIFHFQSFMFMTKSYFIFKVCWSCATKYIDKIDCYHYSLCIYFVQWHFKLKETNSTVVVFCSKIRMSNVNRYK